MIQIDAIFRAHIASFIRDRLIQQIQGLAASLAASHSMEHMEILVKAMFIEIGARTNMRYV